MKKPLLPLNRSPFLRLGVASLTLEYRPNRCQNSLIDSLGFLEFHFAFGRMDIHVDRGWRKRDEQDDGRKLIVGEEVTITIQKGLVNHSILDKASVHVEINSFRISFRKGGETGKPRNPNISLFEPNRPKVLINLLTKNGFDSIV